jgi:hypothetical protein
VAVKSLRKKAIKGKKGLRNQQKELMKKKQKDKMTEAIKNSVMETAWPVLKTNFPLLLICRL